MTADLELTSDGAVLRIDRDADGDLAGVTSLGHVADPGTSYRVPAGLLERLAELEWEWAERVEWGRACREEAEATYRRQRI